MSKDGALGVLGNLDCESNCEPFRLQGDFDPNRTKSKQYCQAIMNGTVSKAEFCDGRVGKFIAQWTSPDRQANLWDFWKRSGRAIDDAAMQADFVLQELKGYPNLFQYLKTTDDLYTAVSRVCKEYERPAINNVDARYQSALRIRDLVSDSGETPAELPHEQPATDDDGIEIPDTWPPRTIDRNCEGFPEIKLAQAALLCHGYSVLIDGIFGDALYFKVKAFQAEHHLKADGVVGPETWRELLKL